TRTLGINYERDTPTRFEAQNLFAFVWIFARLQYPLHPRVVKLCYRLLPRGRSRGTDRSQTGRREPLRPGAAPSTESCNVCSVPKVGSNRSGCLDIDRPRAPAPCGPPGVN